MLGEINECRNVKPLSRWVKEEERACTMCNLIVIAPWYRDLLRDAGKHELAEEIQALGSRDDVDEETLARVLDDIKDRVQDEALREKLTFLDCMAQAFTNVA